MRIIVLTLSDPWAQSDGGTLRTRAMLHGMIELGHQVVAVHPATAAHPPAPAHEVVTLPAPPLGERRIPQPLRKLKRWLLPMPTVAGARSPHVRSTLSSVGAADLLVVSQLSAAQYSEVLPSAGLWIDHSDMWSEFARRSALRRRGPARATGLMQARRLAGEEVRLSNAAKIVTAAGANDVALLGARLSRDVAWLPTPIDVDGGPLSHRRPRTAPVAGFIGNFGFAPNLDALDVLVNDWGPQLHKRGWQVLVAGLGSEYLSLPPWVRCLGTVSSPRDFYEEIDLSLAPIRLGGGMKVKVVESLLYGRPVLASPFAMDGFPRWLLDLVSVAEPDGDLPDDTALERLPDIADPRLQAFSPSGFRDTLRSLLPT